MKVDAAPLPYFATGTGTVMDDPHSHELTKYSNLLVMA